MHIYRTIGGGLNWEKRQISLKDKKIDYRLMNVVQFLTNNIVLFITEERKYNSYNIHYVVLWTE